MEFLLIVHQFVEIVFDISDMCHDHSILFDLEMLLGKIFNALGIFFLFYQSCKENLDLNIHMDHASFVLKLFLEIVKLSRTFQNL